MKPTDNMKTAARELSESFVLDTRADGIEFYKFGDSAPAWITGKPDDCDRIDESVSLKFHRALDSRFPDDWVYQIAAHAADSLCDCCDCGDMRDIVSEIADGLVDVDNISLMIWAADSQNNIALCDEAVEEFAFDASRGIVGIVQAAQLMAIERIVSALIDAIEERAKELDAK